MNPNLFWSASEDGTVRQFDKRCRCQNYCLQSHNRCYRPCAEMIAYSVGDRIEMPRKSGGC